jgi:hypothetical protein
MSATDLRDFVTVPNDDASQPRDFNQSIYHILFGTNVGNDARMIDLPGINKLWADFKIHRPIGHDAEWLQLLGEPQDASNYLKTVMTIDSFTVDDRPMMQFIWSHSLLENEVGPIGDTKILVLLGPFPAELSTWIQLNSEPRNTAVVLLNTADETLKKAKETVELAKKACEQASGISDNAEEVLEGAKKAFDTAQGIYDRAKESFDKAKTAFDKAKHTYTLCLEEGAVLTLPAQS